MWTTINLEKQSPYLLAKSRGYKRTLPLQNIALLHTFLAPADVSAGHTVFRLWAPAALWWAQRMADVAHGLWEDRVSHKGSAAALWLEGPSMNAPTPVNEVLGPLWPWAAWTCRGGGVPRSRDTQLASRGQMQVPFSPVGVKSSWTGPGQHSADECHSWWKHWEGLWFLPCAGHWAKSLTCKNFISFSHWRQESLRKPKPEETM